jgi:hypothetical protein
MTMLLSNHAKPRRKPRMLLRWFGGIVLAVVIPCSLSGCSALSLHKSPPPEQMPTNPWIKPAKPETMSEKIHGFFWKEKKPKEPKDWLNQPRLE